MTIPLADRAVTRYRRSRPRRAGDRPPPRRMCGGLGGRDRRIIAVLAGETIGVFAKIPFWDFMTGTRWAPVGGQAEADDFGVLPL